MKKKFVSQLALCGVLTFAGTSSAMTITAFDNEINLAAALVGSGVTISNVTYTGANAASGYFDGGLAAGIGIERGIVLTSGFADNLNGTSNTSDSITGENFLAGDSDLDTLISGTTFDATVLQFDFEADAENVFFNYVFGSDEYNEYVGLFNDVFGFFFEGANIALIPGTTTPVSINNVNNGLNAGFYNNNDPSDFVGTPTPFPFEYDGFTSVFTATLSGLTIGQTYNIKLAIADAGDTRYDSGVFLQAGTFSTTPTNPVPEPTTMLLFGSGIIALAAAGRRRKAE